MTELVGILNITPDSFSDGGLYMTPDKALEQADKLFTDGAKFVDVGAESTRPGAKPLSHSEEWLRLEPVITVLASRYPDRISLDTYHPETADKALSLGKFIINDVSGMSNPVMAEIIIGYKAKCIICHLPVSDIQASHRGKLINDVVIVKNDLISKAEKLHKKGLLNDQIILDPGIGFGKTTELNWRLLDFANEIPTYQVMVVYSRKRFLGEQRMEIEPNLEAGRRAIQAGAAFLRVHDVDAHSQLLY
jgi:dihydropteroate synthase